MHNTTFDDYMLRAVLASVNAARETCGSQQMHLAGYCIGGTIVTALMAWVNRSPEPDAPAAYATFLTALVNYSVRGDIETLIDEDSLHAIDDLMTHHGYLDGRDMAMSFRTLRSNSLIWHLLGAQLSVGRIPTGVRRALLELGRPGGCPTLCIRSICASSICTTGWRKKTVPPWASVQSISRSSGSRFTLSGPNRITSHRGNRALKFASWLPGPSATC